MEHGPDRQVALEVLERFFDLHELDVVARHNCAGSEALRLVRSR
jgi:hypothetical protein